MSETTPVAFCETTDVLALRRLLAQQHVAYTDIRQQMGRDRALVAIDHLLASGEIERVQGPNRDSRFCLKETIHG